MALRIRCNMQSSRLSLQGEFSYVKNYDIVNARGTVQAVDGIIVQLIEKKTVFRSKRDNAEYTTTDAIAEFTGGCVKHMCRSYLEIFDVVAGHSVSADEFSNGALATYKTEAAINALDAEGRDEEELEVELEDLETDEELADLAGLAAVDAEIPDNSTERAAYDAAGKEVKFRDRSINCGLTPLTVTLPMRPWEEDYLTKGIIVQTGRNVFISDPAQILEIKGLVTWRKSINSSAHGLPYTFDLSIADTIFGMSVTPEVLHTVTVKWGYYNNKSHMTSEYEPAATGGGRQTRRRRAIRRTRRRASRS
uniref:Uncharacterized protein n=1 Tax=viral metagenome TaxID=1070528 RepID=A0A6C0DSL7_9ZZZZ